MDASWHVSAAEPGPTPRELAVRRRLSWRLVVPRARRSGAAAPAAAAGWRESPATNSCRLRYRICRFPRTYCSIKPLTHVYTRLPETVLHEVRSTEVIAAEEARGSDWESFLTPAQQGVANGTLLVRLGSDVHPPAAASGHRNVLVECSGTTYCSSP